MKYLSSIIVSAIVLLQHSLCAQELYTAEGYWQEFQHQKYQEILIKQKRKVALSVEEQYYLADFGNFLQQYYDRMPMEEQLKADDMLLSWEFEGRERQVAPAEDFDLRTRDRLVNGIYGAYYGASLVAITELDEPGVAIGVPLMMAGIWQLGPIINARKYEDISLATIRATNSGKFLGLGYGAALGLAIGGDSDEAYKWILGLSSAGSIALGEIAFQTQKKRGYTEGYVEMVRLYGLLGPVVTGLTSLTLEDPNPHLVGGALVVGGIGGILIGKNVANKYNYTAGDTDVVSSLALISGGLGASVAIGSIDNDMNKGLLLIPAATSIAGTIFGQRSVRGLKFSKKQGSTISLASGGAALVGLGAVALSEAEDPGWYFGVSSACALIMHQVIFQSYKRKNLEQSMRLGRQFSKSPMHLSLQVTPEGYLANQQLQNTRYAENPWMTQPVFRLSMHF